MELVTPVHAFLRGGALIRLPEFRNFITDGSTVDIFRCHLRYLQAFQKQKNKRSPLFAIFPFNPLRVRRVKSGNFLPLKRIIGLRYAHEEIVEMVSSRIVTRHCLFVIRIFFYISV